MSEIRAAGILLYRPGTDRHRYLLLVDAKRGEPGPAKGHAEPGEDDRATALRETREETGLDPARLTLREPFRREITYPVRRGPKRVVYSLARVRGRSIRLSREHASYEWTDLDGVLARVPHDNLRAVFRDAAIWLKDPLLRRGLDPAGARALLETEAGGDAPVVAHTAQVAGMARALAEAHDGVDPGDVETAAWLHDLGRARTHGLRHPIEGFRLACRHGHPGYAPPCLSHYTKGASRDELGIDPALADEMWQACDLDTFDPLERLVALADACARGDRRATIDERFDDLVARYGPSPFFDRNRAAAEALRAEWERATGRGLYPTLGIRAG